MTTDPASLAATASILRRLSGSITAMSESIAAASDADNHQLPVSARRAARDLGAAGAELATITAALEEQVTRAAYQHAQRMHQARMLTDAATAAGLVVIDGAVEILPGIRGVADPAAVALRTEALVTLQDQAAGLTQAAATEDAALHAHLGDIAASAMHLADRLR